MLTEEFIEKVITLESNGKVLNEYNGGDEIDQDN